MLRFVSPRFDVCIGHVMEATERKRFVREISQREQSYKEAKIRGCLFLQWGKSLYRQLIAWLKLSAKTQSAGLCVGALKNPHGKESTAYKQVQEAYMLFYYC